MLCALVEICHSTGTGTNENSQMVVGGTLATTGAINQVAKENQEVTNTFGTTEATYTYKRRWPHKSWREVIRVKYL